MAGVRNRSGCAAHISRRGILRVGGLGAIAALLTREIAPTQAAGASVIVIGAGIAGLAAARELRANEFDVVVLEGRERIGGRIHTDRALGPAIDRGASWIHGVNKNPITELADEFGVSTAQTDYLNADLYDTNGGLVGGAKVGKGDDAFAEALKRAKKIGAGLDQDISVGGGAPPCD